MHAIKAVWKNGQIVPSEPVDWPEGSRIACGTDRAEDGIWAWTEANWRDDPESIADWEAWVRTSNGPFTDEERARLSCYREEYRRYNLEAVRKADGGREKANDPCATCDTGIAQDFQVNRGGFATARIAERQRGHRSASVLPVLGELWAGVEGSASRDATCGHCRHGHFVVVPLAVHRRGGRRNIGLIYSE